jgi:chemotaxis methyl-accepting protein methylase
LCADSRTVDIPKADAILFNDSLHYVDMESQRSILLRSVASLNDGGMILVRDGDVWMRDFAEENNLKIKIHNCDKGSSETLYILTKQKDDKR